MINCCDEIIIKMLEGFFCMLRMLFLVVMGCASLDLCASSYRERSRHIDSDSDNDSISSRGDGDYGLFLDTSDAADRSNCNESDDEDELAVLFTTQTSFRSMQNIDSRKELKSKQSSGRVFSGLAIELERRDNALVASSASSSSSSSSSNPVRNLATIVSFDLLPVVPSISSANVSVESNASNSSSSSSAVDRVLISMPVLPVSVESVVRPLSESLSDVALNHQRRKILTCRNRMQSFDSQAGTGQELLSVISLIASSSSSLGSIPLTTPTSVSTALSPLIVSNNSNSAAMNVVADSRVNLKRKPHEEDQEQSMSQDSSSASSSSSATMIRSDNNNISLSVKKHKNSDVSVNRTHVSLIMTR